MNSAVRFERTNRGLIPRVPTIYRSLAESGQLRLAFNQDTLGSNPRRPIFIAP